MGEISRVGAAARVRQGIGWMLAMVMAASMMVGITLLATPQASAASCQTVVTKAYENEVKPSSACSDVNVNEVRKYPLLKSTVDVWGQYRNSSGNFVNAKAGTKTYKKGTTYSQWPAIKSLKAGSVYRMRGTSAVEFVLRV